MVSQTALYRSLASVTILSRPSRVCQGIRSRRELLNSFSLSTTGFWSLVSFNKACHTHRKHQVKDDESAHSRYFMVLVFLSFRLNYPLSALCMKKLLAHWLLISKSSGLWLHALKPGAQVLVVMMELRRKTQNLLQFLQNAVTHRVDFSVFCFYSVQLALDNNHLITFIKKVNEFRSCIFSITLEWTVCCLAQRHRSKMAHNMLSRQNDVRRFSVPLPLFGTRQNASWFAEVKPW